MRLTNMCCHQIKLILEIVSQLIVMNPSPWNISKVNDNRSRNVLRWKKVKNLSVQSKSKSVKVTAPVIKGTYDLR